MSDFATSRTPSGGEDSTVQQAKEQTKNVGNTAVESGGEVLQTAKDQSKQVAAEAGRQARDLYGQARAQVRDQAGTQQKRAAEGIRSISGEIRGMAEQGGQSGPASEIARQASGKIEQVADWLENKEPGAIITEVKDYARRNPGTFLVGAALLGVLAGRLTKNLAAEAKEGASNDSYTPSHTGTLYAGATSGYPETATTATAYPETYPATVPTPVVDEPVYSPAPVDPLAYPATTTNPGGEVRP